MASLLASRSVAAALPTTSSFTESSNGLSSRQTLKAPMTVNRSSDFMGGRLVSHELERRSTSRSGGSAFQVEMAVSRTKKEATVEKVKKELEGCTFAAAFTYTGLSVKQMQELRRSMPPDVTVMVVKNKLVGKAIEGNEKFEALKPMLKSMNCWLFVHGEEFAAAIKPYRELQKQYKLESDFVGGVLDGSFVAPKEFEKVEKLPTKKEVMAKLAGAIKAVPTKLARSIKMVPTKVAIATDKLREKLEEEEK